MLGASDEAFLRLAVERGALDPALLAQLLAAPPRGQRVEVVLVEAGALSAAAAGALRDELRAWVFGCGRCGAQIGSAQLAALPRLACPCGGPLTPLRARPESGSFPLPSPDPVPRGPEDSDFVSNAFGSGHFGQLGVHPGGTLGPYRIGRELGRGANGAVFLATRADREGSYALKVLLEGTTQDAETIARFQLEAAIGSKLRDPGVVKVHDVGRVGDQLYYAMEFSPGKTLRDLLRETGRLPWREAAELVSQLALTLAHCHEHSVIHRDVKPGNIILDEAMSRPRLTDFGLARDRTLAQTMTQSGDWLGTPYYMSPEQFLGQTSLDHRVDIYALGVILFEALTGERPYVAKTATELMELVLASAPPEPCALVPDLPPGLDQICRRAMANHRDERYASGRELAVALQRVLSGEDPTPSNTTTRSALLAILAASTFTIGAALYSQAGPGGSSGASPSPSVARRTPSVRGGQLRAAEVELAGRWSRLLADPALWSAGPDPQLLESLRTELTDARSAQRLEALSALGELLRAARRGAPWQDLGLILARARGPSDWADYRARLSLVEARLLIARGRSADALEHLGPDLEDPQARWLRLEALEAQGSAADAQRLLRRLREESGPVGAMARARSARATGEHADALAAARQALGFPGARLEEARALLAQGDAQGSTEALEDHVRAWGAGATSWMLEGDRAAARDDLPGAAQSYGRAAGFLEVDRSSELDLRRARIALRQGDPLQARQLLEASASVQGDAPLSATSIGVLVLRGLARFELGDAPGAEEDWRRARAEDITLTEAAWPSFASAAAKAAFPGNARRESFEFPKDDADTVGAILGGGLGLLRGSGPSWSRLSPLGQVSEEVRRRLAAPRGASATERDLASARLAAAEGKSWEDVMFFLKRALGSGAESGQVRATWIQLALARCQELEPVAARLAGDLAIYGLSPAEGELARGLTTWAQGRAGAALGTFKALSEREPSRREGAIASVLVALLQAEYEEMLAAAERLVAAHPSSRAHALEGLAQLALGHLSEAAASQQAGFALDGASDHFLLALRACLCAGAEAKAQSLGARALDQLNLGGQLTQLILLRVLLERDQSQQVHFATSRLLALVRLESGEFAQLRGYAWVRRGKERGLCLSAWQSARTSDPDLALPAPYLAAYREAYGDSQGLSELR